MQITINNSHNALINLQCAFYNFQFPICAPHLALRTNQFSICNVQLSIFNNPFFLASNYLNSILKSYAKAY
jgi:hypothetical protein